jgi:hypothetical protein
LAGVAVGNLYLPSVTRIRVLRLCMFLSFDRTVVAGASLFIRPSCAFLTQTSALFFDGGSTDGYDGYYELAGESERGSVSNPAA